jgi:glycosyltransferase involved in cell wall biosynthesis
MYSIQVLIATMFKKNKIEIIQLLENMNIDSDCVIINQCDTDNIEQVNYKKHSIQVINSTERGLSKSRNLALQHASADIVVIADDDMRYIDGYAQIIINAYNTHPNDDILTFKV